MSLRSRLALFIAIAVAVAVSVVAVVAYGFASHEARGEVDEFLTSRGPAVGLFRPRDLNDFFNLPRRGRGGRQGSPSGPAPATTPFSDVVREDVIAQFIDGEGTIVSLSVSSVTLPLDEHDLTVARVGGDDYLRDVSIEGVHFRVLTRHLGPNVAIQVARDVRSIDSILAGLRLRLTLLGVFGVVTASAVAWLIADRSLRPVAALTEAAERVAATHQLEARIEVDRADELGRLGAAFNAMLAGLEEARLSQQRLVEDASHELRTPLTSLRTNIELLALGAVDGSERTELVDDLNTEVGELSHLVNELVALATIGSDEEPWVELDLSAVAQEAIRRLERRTDLSIETDLERTIMKGRPNGLSRSISNLLDNAAKWGRAGTSIEIQLRDLEFSVRDHGPGIPESDLSRVFERFYRSPEARSRPGSGLGLSIVAAVAADHDAEVFARNAHDGGAVVGFRLPRSGQ